MSQEYIFHNSNGENNKVEPYLGIHMNNNNIFVGLAYDDANFGKMPVVNLTANIATLPYLMAAIDIVNNGQEVMNFLIENKLATPIPGRVLHSEFGDFPVATFSEEALAKIDPEVFEQYQRAHGIEPVQDQREANQLTLHYLGNDDFSRPVYRIEGESFLLKDNELGSGRYTPDLHVSCPRDDFYGEPNYRFKTEKTLKFVADDGLELPDNAKFHNERLGLSVGEREPIDTSLGNLINHAKEKAEEKNQAHEGHDHQPTKKPHDMDR